MEDVIDVQVFEFSVDIHCYFGRKSTQSGNQYVFLENEELRQKPNIWKRDSRREFSPEGPFER